MTDPFYIYRPMLDLLGKSEGTDKGRGYNETLSYGAYTGGDKELVAMTLDRIDELQTAMLRHPKNYLNSSALGRYQIVRTTLRKIRKKLKLSGREVYSATMQDRMGCFLLGGRGIDRWLKGKKSDNAMLLALAQEWASLPTPEGRGYYDGQNSSVSVAEVKRTLAEVKKRWDLHGANAPAIPKAKPTGAAAATGVAVATGAGAAAASGTDSYAGLFVIGGLALVAVLLGYVLFRYRDEIAEFLKSIGSKL